MRTLLLLGLLIITGVSTPWAASASGFTIPYQSGWIGPQLNVHFGQDKVQYSAGLEVSYWRQLESSEQSGWREVPQLGVDVGIEYNFSRETWLHYGEVQAGIILAGASLGVVFDGEHGAGWQLSSWVNWVVGGMLRYRWFDDAASNNSWSLGGSAKAPYLVEDGFLSGW